MARLVLIHGAFGGAWVWEPVLDALRAAGHTPEPVDLPGAGDDPTPLEQVTLDLYGLSICEVLAKGEPAVLVGQSMGGLAITQAAAHCPGNISLLLYVGAFAPQPGQSLMDLVAYPEAADDQVQAHMVVEGDPPTARLPPEAAINALYNCADPDSARWAAERLGPQSVGALQNQLTVPGENREAFEALPRAYIVCRHDRAIPPAMQRRMLSDVGCDPVIELDTDHWPWMSRTEEFVEALDKVLQARAVQPS
jgi:pimeloyl-ACP methyl ester carboxylesterase